MEVERIGVVGLGAMGAGIAQLAIEAGFEAVGREVTAELGETAAGRIGHFLTRKVEKGQRTQDERDAAIARLVTTTELADLADCDLVIEAIVEELDAKRELFAELERICRADAVLATNTSALSVTEIAAATATPERVVGMHFFNPAPLMPLVEIVRAELSVGRGRRGGARGRRAARQGRRSVPRHARLRRQPRPDPAAERLRARPRRGARDAGGRSTRR